MGFAGHVLEMIRRDKAYRDQRNLRRSKAKQHRQMYVGSGAPPPSVTAEELEHINRQTKMREAEQERYFIRMTLIVLAGLVVVTLLLLGILFAF